MFNTKTALKLICTPNTFCSFHWCDNIIVDKSLPFLIFKYVKGKLKKKPQQFSSGHYGKIKHFIVA